jgi:hypothetical protein
MIFDEGNSSDRIIQAVDEGLMSLGSSARRVIYYILDRRFQLRPADIPENLQLSHTTLFRPYPVRAPRSLRRQSPSASTRVWD